MFVGFGADGRWHLLAVTGWPAFGSSPESLERLETGFVEDNSA